MRVRDMVPGRLRGGAGPVTGNLEYLFECDDVCVASGWSSQAAIEGPTGTESHVYRYVRADANSAVGAPDDQPSGFLLLALASESGVRRALQEQGIGGNPSGRAEYVREGARLGLLGAALAQTLTTHAAGRFEPIRRLLPVQEAEPQGAGPARPSGGLRVHVDFAFWIEAASTLVLQGWAPRGSDVAILGTDAADESFGVSVGWLGRPDVVNEIGPGYAGFTATSVGAIPERDVIGVVIAKDGASAYLDIPVVTVTSADPLTVARSLFSMPTHAREFIGRLDEGEGEAMAAVIRAWNDDPANRGHRVLLTCGRQADAPAPALSVIVPLYARYDLLWNQFQSWSRSARVAECEFILVNDDPTHEVECAELVEQLLAVFDLPVTLIANERNRGFAGACNVGVSAARGPAVMLLNSDAILDDLDAALRVAEMLDEHPHFGAVGAQLVGPDRLSVHSGMACTWLPSRASWFNYHPGSGIPHDPAASPEWQEVDAVTGALLVMRTADLTRMGGLSEDFLIGDYEDSDLCWRVQEMGMAVVLAPGLVAAHLERTSMSLIGSDDFREKVSLFNSWLHAKRWGDRLHGQFGNDRTGGPA